MRLGQCGDHREHRIAAKWRWEICVGFTAVIYVFPRSAEGREEASGVRPGSRQPLAHTWEQGISSLLD